MSQSENQTCLFKKFKLKKCIRNLLKCKSVKHESNNYEYMSYGETTTMSIEPLSSTQAIKHCFNNQQLNLSQITNQESLFNQTNSTSSEIEQSRDDSTETKNLIIFNRSVSISNVQSIYLFNTTCFNNDDINLHSTKIQQYECLDKSLENHLTHLLMQNIQHFCIASYEATFVNDLTVSAGQPIQILKDNNDDEWLYVQVCEKQGYVPKHVIANINTYLTQLKKQISAISLPIQV